MAIALPRRNLTRFLVDDSSSERVPGTGKQRREEMCAYLVDSKEKGGGEGELRNVAGHYLVLGSTGFRNELHA